MSLLQDMEFRRPLQYFTIPGMAMFSLGLAIGMDYLQVFFNGGSLQYELGLVIVFLLLMGSIIALTGIILHSISRVCRYCTKDISRY